jgi:hypothetical protein
MGNEVTKSASRWTEAEARASLDAWRRSGESELAFARRGGFSPQRLRYWRERLGGPTKDVAAAAAFVAVSMPVVARAASQIEIRMGAMSVCVREDIDVDHLARIVGALAGVRAC